MLTPLAIACLATAVLGATVVSVAPTRSSAYRTLLAALTVLGPGSACLAVVAFTERNTAAGLLSSGALAVLLLLGIQQASRLRTDLQTARRALQAARLRRHAIRRR